MDNGDATQLPAGRLNSIAFASVGVFIIYVAAVITHRLFFHPLHHIPGPKVNALSRLPYVRHLLAGTTAHNVLELHEKYGEVVRLTPNEISISSGETAWQEIYGFRTGKQKGQMSMQKDRAWYAKPPLSETIIVANDETHSRFRRVLSHSFSESSLARQEPLVQGYADLLINRLKEVTLTSAEPQDMTKWYNWATFDVIADLMFGEPFGCLQDLKTHHHIDLLFESLQSFRFWYIGFYYPSFVKLRNMFAKNDLMRRRIEFTNWVHAQTQKRIKRDTQRPDFMTEILKHNGEKGVAMTDLEMSSNAGVILTAGSETTATLLSAVTFLLLTNTDKQEKLKAEIRGKWKTYDEITIDQVNNTTYLIAVLQEALRFFPPVPTGFQRKVPEGGAVINGYYVPEDTGVAVSSVALGRSEQNFTDPDAFVPERWLGDPKYADDKRSTVQPFSFGPRNCIGKNLAYAEMRLFLSKMIWSFDMTLDAKSATWLQNCTVKTLWDKPELAVHIKEVVRAD